MQAQDTGKKIEGSQGLLISSKQARHELGDIGETKYHELINAGAFQTVLIGRHRKVIRSSLEAYIAKLVERQNSTMEAA